MVALEQTELPYQDKLVKLMEGEQRTPEYLAINPKGKVPALRIGDALLTETPIIISYLDRLAPHAKLLPATDDPLTRAQYVADMVWASSTLHGSILRLVVAPFRMTDGDPSGLKVKGLALLAEQAESISSRLSPARWWYGDDWSIMDVFVMWVFTSAQQIGSFDLARFPVLVDHIERVRAQPAFQRTLIREKAVLDRAGVKMPTAAPPVPAKA
jgi:glutathione S-transferase